MEAQAQRRIATHTAPAVLMVEPNTFGFDSETALTNAFQHKISSGAADVTSQAMAEYAAVYEALSNFGIEVVGYSHELTHYRPNAVFPNNWLTTWPDGRIYLYPMAHASRRSERMAGVIDELELHFRVNSVKDLSGFERRGQYLEGTGAIVFDHRNRTGYGCRSARCDASLFVTHMRELEYEAVLFNAKGPDGSPVYHTNVMMGIQESTAVVCSEAITDETQRNVVLNSLKESGHDLVEISYAQLNRFCGNLIQLRNTDGRTGLLMSESAHGAFTAAQLGVLGRDNDLIIVPVPTIEEVGGGGVRCMVAELFLPLLKR